MDVKVMEEGENCENSEDRGLIKRDGGLKMEECLRTLFFRAGLRQEGDGCEDETATVSEG